MSIDVKVPVLPESVTDATVATWYKKPGDFVKRDENLVIPENVNYDDISGLSNEVKAKFKQIKPKTMGQALRIDGITPAAVYILLSHVKRKSIKLIA